MVGSLILSIASWTLFMEMNSSQDKIWSNSNISKLNKDRLHNLDAIGVFFLGITIAFLYNGFSVESSLLALFFLFSRSGYFSWRMNMKRIKDGVNIKWNHLGDGRWDRTFKGNETLYFILCFSGMIATIFLLTLEFI